MNGTGPATTPPEHDPAKVDTARKSVRSGSWRDEAKARATRLRADARWLTLPNESRPETPSNWINLEILSPLEQADRYAFSDRESLREWLSGSQVEETWRLLRQAEEGILQAVLDGDVPIRAKLAEEQGEKVLGSNHPFVAALRLQLKDIEAEGADKKGADEKARAAKTLRSTALEVLRETHVASDRGYRDVRSFRNQLLLLTVVLLIIAGLLLAAQQMLLDTHLIPAPSGAKLNPTRALGLVMFFGCIGALFSAVPSLAQVPETSSPFKTLRWQAALKVVTGGWSAVIGLLVVNAGLAGTNPQVASLGGLVVLAALFGAGQEAVTRFADHKASDILRSA